MFIIYYIKLLFLTAFQDSIIFKPDPDGIKPLKNPIEYGLSETSTVSINITDEEKIDLWVRQPDNKEKGLMFIYFHGNTGHIADVGKPESEDVDRNYRIKFLKQISKQGHGFTAISHRGFGLGSGEPSEENFAEDIKFLADFLQQEKNLKLVLVGESLGASSALKLNEELLNKNIIAESVILIAPFVSIMKKIEDLHPEILRFDVESRLRHKFDNKKIISQTQYKKNLILAHPTEDETTPIYHSEELLEIGKQNNLNIKLERLEGSDHITWDPKDILEIVEDNIARN